MVIFHSYVSLPEGRIAIGKIMGLFGDLNGEFLEGKSWGWIAVHLEWNLNVSKLFGIDMG
jgi:hypothetical protein